jgi:metal-responsive CopG/Arc/MetJ family transcriptional regulator
MTLAWLPFGATEMAKIAISLPDQVLDAVEQNRKEQGVSRSELIRRAIERYLRVEGEFELEKRYIEGYLRHPESSTDATSALNVGLEALSWDPWESEDAP